MIMGCDFQVEIKGGNHRQASSEEVSHVERSQLGDISAQYQADADAYIP